MGELEKPPPQSHRDEKLLVEAAPEALNNLGMA